MKTRLLTTLLFASAALGVPPTVSNIRASQQAGTKLVNIVYDLADHYDFYSQALAQRGMGVVE